MKLRIKNWLNFIKLGAKNYLYQRKLGAKNRIKTLDNAIMAKRQKDAIIIYTCSNISSSSLQFGDGITHGDACSSLENNAHIVATVTESDGVAYQYLPPLPWR